MTLGIDLTVLQTPHRMRGIGSTVINFINNLALEEKKKHDYIFFVYKEDESPLDLLNLADLNYQVRYVSKIERIQFRLPGRLSIVNGVLNQARTYSQILLGDARLKQLNDLDIFLQFDQNQPLPSRSKVKSLLVVYDIIPYVLESDYLWGYRTARSHGKTRLGALRTLYHRKKYISRLRKITARAQRLIAISQHTKEDFIKYVGVRPEKIDVCYLGVATPETQDTTPVFHQYVSSSWGYIPKQVDLSDKQFILFVGGADPRRKLVDLVASFNNLRAQGHDIRLILAGDTMNGAYDVPNTALQYYFKHTSYLDDIIFVGFISDTQRDWLYSNAVAFIYPSIYEGFGLPILEAMRYGTPVITYNNSSISEIAGDAVLYAKDFKEIREAIESLISEPAVRKLYKKRGLHHSQKFKWQDTSKQILSIAKTTAQNR